ncbi:MAG TPA: hypothetical protein VK966_03060, partial [Longimicrobiales bacterium]|nr:hypothetical protein [Longimicrobiales bacterium]
MTNILFHAHSGIRYLVLLAGVVALVYMLWNMTRSRPWNETGQTLLGVFVGVMDLQVLLGLILLLLRPFFPALIGHIVLMLLAVSVGHVASAMNRKRPPEKQTY